MKAPLDRRVRRTRRQLREALVSLILARGWDRVTVQDVCEAADVGRSTFYVHFADKEELLLSGFDDLHAALGTMEHQHAEPFGFAASLLVHAKENQRLFRAVVGRRSGAAVQRRFRAVVTELVEAGLARAGVPQMRRPVVARFVSGGFVEMLLGWLDRPAGTDARAVAESFQLFAAGVVAAARRG